MRATLSPTPHALAYGWHGALVELRGGPRNVKVSTRRAPVQGSTIFWNEPLVLWVLGQMQ